jgi:hypothetical protein
MKTLGCLTVIVLVGVGIFLLANSQDMTEDEKAQWVGDKAHRGWNRVRQLMHQAREGWRSTEQPPAEDANR